MPTLTTKFRLLAASGVLALAALRAAPDVTVTFDLWQPGPSVPEHAVGLSYETSLLRPDAQGVRYFRPDNRALLQVLHTLGVTHLRIGGNSVDDPKVPVPEPEDVRSFFEFARKAGVKVLYSVRLQGGDPAPAAAVARMLHGEFRDQLEAFSIGNEPGYYKDYDVYRAKWTAIRDAIVREFPEARFAGPDTNPEPKMIRAMALEYGNPAGRLVQITQHSYPFGCSYTNPSIAWKDPKAVGELVPFDAAEARQRMMDRPPYGIYEEILLGMEAAVKGTALTFRLTETNSFWFSGLEGASDRYASALWAVEYLHWWVSQGAAGLNFHTGDRTGGSVNLPCRYSAFVSSAAGYEVRPLAYGMKLFSTHAGGRYVSVNVKGDGRQRVAAYATRQTDGRWLVTLVNRDTTSETNFRIELPRQVRGARTLDLRAKGNDLAADSSGVALGGAPISSTGEWHGQWTPLDRDRIDGRSIKLTLPPASASVVEIALE